MPRSVFKATGRVKLMTAHGKDDVEAADVAEPDDVDTGRR